MYVHKHKVLHMFAYPRPRISKWLSLRAFSGSACFILSMLFMINLTIDLYYYYDYVNMYLVCTFKYGSLLFSYCYYLSFPLQNSMYFFTKQHICIWPTQIHFRFPPNLFLAIVNIHEMCHANYSTWLYIYTFLEMCHANYSRGCAGGRIGTRFLRPRGTSPLKGVNPAGTPGYIYWLW